jgi:hypothetical protein
MRNHRFFAFLCLLCCASSAPAQIQHGTIQGVVSDATGARIANAAVQLSNTLASYRATLTTDGAGAFTFSNLPYAVYEVRVEAAGFAPFSARQSLRANVSLTLQLTLSVSATTAATDVKAQRTLIEVDNVSTTAALPEEFIRRTPGATSSLNVQRMVATLPGWMTENNGLLHVRGVDDGVLYVIDGIPTADRLDALSASNFDTEMIRSLNVITGNIPAEFGGRSGAVIQIQPRSGLDGPFVGQVGTHYGSFNAGEFDASLGRNVKNQFGFFVTSAATRSNRWLDPVHPGNFNNHGGALKLIGRVDWHPTARDILLFNGSANGTDFHVTNNEEQEEARQRQRQQLRDNAQSFSWQRMWSAGTVTNLAAFRRAVHAELIGSENDTPLFAAQDRQHTRLGLLAGLTTVRSGHTWKFGLEATRLAPREFFTFAITDPDEAEEFEISYAALQFTRDNPFVFRGQRTGSYVAAFAQDSFSPFRNLTVNAGLRFDRSTLPVTAHQFSPRVGIVYALPRTGTALRASFNRLFMPPQLENLLLADSPEARRLSPFLDHTTGGAPIKPETMSAYEVGIAQDVRGWFKLDLAFWDREFRNFDDPNVFFNTTIIFPNSVTKGFARGVEARLDVPLRKGWSGYASYTNARVLQTGPINGGLFLTDEFAEIEDGHPFIPDHDQRNVAAFGLMHARSFKKLGDWWVSFGGRHESGTPLQVEAARLEELRAAPGAELVNFERGRVKPWTVLDFSTGFDWLRRERVAVSFQFDYQNFTNRAFAYNFGNPFEGTHFGHPRLISGKLKFNFR